MRNPLDWNDLRFFLAVATTGSLSAAARELNVDAGTVSRRVAAMETALRKRFFERRPDGYSLSEYGRLLLEHALRVQQEIVSLDRSLDAAEDREAGLVSITASEPIASGFLLPSLVGLHDRLPGLRFDILTDNRLYSLTKREVDIAIRMNRSEEDELLARRIGTLNFGLYASLTYLEKRGTPANLDELCSHQLIDWLEDHPRAGPLVWFRELTLKAQPFLRLNSSRERLTAVQLGLGITALPYLVARDAGLERLLPHIVIPPLEVWLLAHPEGARIKRIRAVMRYLTEEASVRALQFTDI